jgi:hypothetical protein
MGEIPLVLLKGFLSYTIFDSNQWESSTESPLMMERLEEACVPEL